MKVGPTGAPLVDPHRLLAEPDALRELTARLSAAGYDLATSHGRMGLGAEPSALLTRSAFFSFAYGPHFADSDEPLDVVLALFWLNASVDALRYEAVVPRELRELFDWLELVDAEAERVTARVSIVELDGVLLLSDPLFRNRPDGGIAFLDMDELVMPFHASSAELLERVRTPPGARGLLDVGCGSGALALALSRRYERVAGIDVHERAVVFARANALANAIEAEFEAADAETYEPTATFPHAVFNAPCEPASWNKGVRAATGAVVRMIARAATSCLDAGGLLQAHCIVPVPIEDESVADTLGRMFADYGLAVDVRPVADSPFALRPEALAAGTIPRDSYLLREPDDAGWLVERLREERIHEVVSTVLDVSPRHDARA
jgi:methylase of polypeptide subunit release factors